MTAPVPTRFSEKDLAVLDRLVSEGVGQSRSEVIRRAVLSLDDALRRAKIGERIAESYRHRPQSAEEEAFAMSNAIAMTEAESW